MCPNIRLCSWNWLFNLAFRTAEFAENIEVSETEVICLKFLEGQKCSQAVHLGGWMEKIDLIFSIIVTYIHVY